MAASISLTRVPVRLRALRRGVLPGPLAAPVRAALGPALRRVACVAETPCRSRCARPETCAFGLAFSALPPRPGWGGTPPRPFWLQYDAAAPRGLVRGDTIEVAVVATPAAADHLDTVIDALAVAAGRGVAGIPFALDGAGPAESHDLAGATRASEGWGDDVAVRFATPLRLKEHGHLRPVVPSLAALVRAITTRANALATLYGGASWDTDLRAVVERAGAASCTLDRTHWLGLLRQRRNRRPDSLSGLVGEAVYAPVHDEVKPWLALASVLHVGADTMFGCGRIIAGPARSVPLEPESLQLVAALAAETVRRIAGAEAHVAVTFAGTDAVTVHADDPHGRVAAALEELAAHLGVRIDLDAG